MTLLRSRRSARRAAAQATLALYYASDVHGSDTCWRKFLGAGRFYGVDALIMGGDLAGKAIVPITERSDGLFEATLVGEKRVARSADELDDLVAAVRFNGMYPWVASAEEIARHQHDPAAKEALFERVMLEELQRWIELADERLSSSGLATFVMAGNDDPWTCDAVIAEAEHVQRCDDRVVQVGPHEMISCSFSNPTPWKSPRELDEDALYKRIKRLAEQLEAPASAIFNLHVPPFDSGLDRANEVREDLTLVFIGGRPHEIPVGSTAVRQIIEEYQPLVSLHGHIHESRADTRIGRTLAINPGSDYNSGRIHGVVAKLAGTEVLSHQFVAG